MQVNSWKSLTITNTSGMIFSSLHYYLLGTSDKAGSRLIVPAPWMVAYLPCRSNIDNSVCEYVMDGSLQSNRIERVQRMEMIHEAVYKIFSTFHLCAHEALAYNDKSWRSSHGHSVLVEYPRYIPVAKCVSSVKYETGTDSPGVRWSISRDKMNGVSSWP